MLHFATVTFLLVGFPGLACSQPEPQTASAAQVVTTRAQEILPLAKAEDLAAWGLRGVRATAAQLEIDNHTIQEGMGQLEWIHPKTFEGGFQLSGAGADSQASGFTLSSRTNDLTLFEAPDQGRVFTLEFYIHPRGLDLNARLAMVPAKDGSLRLISRLVLESSDNAGLDLDPDQWNYVAYSADLERTCSARLIVNGEVRSTQPGESLEEGRDPARVPNPIPGVQLKGFEDLGANQGFTIADVRLAPLFVSSQRLLEPQVNLSPATAQALRKPTFPWGHAEVKRAVVRADGLDWTPANWSRDEPRVVNADGQPDPTLAGPLPRTCHAITSLGDGRLLMYGGELRDTHEGQMANGDDTWIYDMRTQTWRAIDGPAPPARCHIGMAATPDGALSFLHGGWYNPGRNETSLVYDDNWMFDRDQEVWTQLPQAEAPCPVSDVQPVFDQSRGVFFFATAKSLWTLDPAEGLFTWQPGLPTYVSASDKVYRGTPGEAMTWYDPENQMTVRWGGYVRDDNGKQVLQDEIFLFAAKAKQLVRMASKEVVPAARTRGAVAYDTKRKRLMMFGGILGGLDERENDLWSFDLESNTWTEHAAANPPGKRGGYFAMAYDEDLDTFLVPFGRQDRRTFVDEVWRLTWRPEEAGTAHWRFNVTDWARQIPQATWRDEVMGTVEWRLSSDAETWGPWQSEGAVGSDSTGKSGFAEVRVTLPPDARLESLKWILQ